MDVDLAPHGRKLADVKQENQSSQEEVDLDSMTLDERLKFLQQREHEEWFLIYSENNPGFLNRLKLASVKIEHIKINPYLEPLKGR